METLAIISPAPRYYRNQTPLRAVHLLTNQASDGSVLGTGCGRTFARSRTHLQVTAEPITCAACRKLAQQ